MLIIVQVIREQAEKNDRSDTEQAEQNEIDAKKVTPPQHGYYIERDIHVVSLPRAPGFRSTTTTTIT